MVRKKCLKTEAARGELPEVAGMLSSFNVLELLSE